MGVEGILLQGSSSSGLCFEEVVEVMEVEGCAEA